MKLSLNVSDLVISQWLVIVTVSILRQIGVKIEYGITSIDYIIYHYLNLRGLYTCDI